MDTDPNPEVSALLSALDETPKDDDTGETGESENLEADEQDSAEEAQPEAPEDENESPAKLVLEFDGKQWELPPGTPPEIAEGVKKVADELKADYTRKRQVAAEQEKTIRQHAEALQESQQIAAATFEKSLELSLINRQIQQIESIDWQALANEDPSRASVLQMEHTKLMRQAQALQGQVQQMAMYERQKLQTTKQEAFGRIPPLRVRGGRSGVHQPPRTAQAHQLRAHGPGAGKEPAQGHEEGERRTPGHEAPSPRPAQAEPERR